jgi:hypothetical protein
MIRNILGYHKHGGAAWADKGEWTFHKRTPEIIWWNVKHQGKLKTPPV